MSKKAQKLKDMTSSEIDNEKGKQSCHQSQPMEKTTIFHEGWNHKEEDGKGEQLEPTMPSNPSFHEQEDNHPSDVLEESNPNFPYEECNQLVEVFVSDFLKKISTRPYIMNVRMTT